MRKLSAALLALALASSIAQAQRAPDPASAQRHQLAEPADQQLATYPRAELDEAQLVSHRHYKATNGNVVHSPSRTRGDVAPAGASAKCRDGTWSFSQSRRGTCSHHGGVGSWY
ncbi:DUF3761 domain-containing protein [Massilia sp. Mn16-1_5]|uniref:DUF3761 domain-containing protein n=1 Tax=Massilia sp. Mn16-1_5 TaxID=2079199 RepID=UPI00109EC3C7|nr:DUF3761 domain-containing protein [Massilia sp. Mn16-1_5]THC39419.1 hypothetical protein C2862_23985 [Massilia sp. Mn16-1_5]